MGLTHFDGYCDDIEGEREQKEIGFSINQQEARHNHTRKRA